MMWVLLGEAEAVVMMSLFLWLLTSYGGATMPVVDGRSSMRAFWQLLDRVVRRVRAARKAARQPVAWHLVEISIEFVGVHWWEVSWYLPGDPNQHRKHGYTWTRWGARREVRRHVLRSRA